MWRYRAVVSIVKSASGCSSSSSSSASCGVSIRCRAFASGSGSFPDWIPKPKLRRKLQKSCELAVPTQQMYEVVSDVQSYEQFVPYCVKSRILSKKSQGRPHSQAPRDHSQHLSSKEFDAELQIGFRLFHESHVSRVTCKEPQGAEGGYVKAEALPGGLCDSLISVWSFKPTATGGCKLSFNVDFEISNPLHAAAIASFFEQVTLQQMTAFCERAEAFHKESLRRQEECEKQRELEAIESGTPTHSPSRLPFVQLLQCVFNKRKVRLEKNYLNEEEDSTTVVVGLGLPEFLLCCRDLADKRVHPFSRIISHCDHANTNNTFLLASCFSSFDKNGDGIVEEAEWIAGSKLFAEQDPERKARMLHAYFDQNGDGYVRASEVSSMLKSHLKSLRQLMPEILRMDMGSNTNTNPTTTSDRDGEKDDAADGEEREGGSNRSNMLVLCATMDLLLHEAEGEVSDYVDHVFSEIGIKNNKISLALWIDSMAEQPELLNLVTLEGFLEMTELAMVTKESVNN